MTDNTLPNVDAPRVVPASSEARAELRKYERLLAGSLSALMSSPISQHWHREDVREELADFCVAMATRGVRLGHQGSWSEGIMQPLDNADPSRLAKMEARDFRFQLLPERNTGGCPVYAGGVVGLVSSPGPRPVNTASNRHPADVAQHQVDEERWNSRRANLVTLLHEFDVTFLDRVVSAEDDEQRNAVALIWRQLDGELPPARELPAGSKAIDARLREKFLAGEDCSYVEPKAWEL